MKMRLKGLVVAAFLVFLGVSSANAATLRANIPFEFTVGNATLPAGTYTVSQLAQGVLVIRNENLGSAAALVMVNSTMTTTPQAGASLFFNRDGNQYFLKQVWTGGPDSAGLVAATSARAITPAATDAITAASGSDSNYTGSPSRSVIIALG